ncbi:MAG: hypothetical protein ACYCPT_01845 [Acidimicrobiales bacterium]
MSEYMFGLGRGRLTPKACKDFDRVAAEYGARFSGNPELPGDGYRWWFACENLGAPFDELRSKDVLDALERAGYLDEGVWTDRCFARKGAQ